MAAVALFLAIVILGYGSKVFYSMTTLRNKKRKVGGSRINSTAKLV